MAYEMRISDCSSDVCSSDLFATVAGFAAGILMAPKSGKETRAELKQKADQAKQTAELKADQAKAAEKAASASVKTDRKRVVEGKSVSVRVDRGGRRNCKKNITRLRYRRRD